MFYRFCRRYVEHYNGENNSDMYSNGEFRWLREVLPRCKVVFDVGANVGDWTALARNVNPAIQVHCFEPSGPTFQRLQMQSFGEAQISLNQIGLSASAGEIALHVFEEGAGANSLYRREGLGTGQTRMEKVRLDTLDAYCQRRAVSQIDLLKLDVEGHELMVLKDAAQMLGEGRIRRIQFEYGGTYIDSRTLLKDVFELLCSYGYRLHKIYPHQLYPVVGYEQRLENLVYQNWVALR
jgi:FkbM family methyltransferase